jgi:hypothetical protein
MANVTILNAAPMVVSRGTQDLSGSPLPQDGDTVATHIPLVPIYAQRGPDRALVSGSDRTTMFGSDTFDMRKEFATHATELSNLLAAQGNAHVIARMKPNDRGPRANFALSLDLLPTDVVQYKRDAEGNLLLDPTTNDPIVDAAAPAKPGYRGRFVLTHLTALSDENQFSVLRKKPGLQTNGTVQSMSYPILQGWASSFGKDFNNSGIRLWAPTTQSQIPMASLAMNSTGCYPFRMAVIRRDSAADTPRPVESLTGDQYLDFTFKPDVIDSYTDARFSLQDIYKERFTHTQNDGTSIVYGEFEDLKVYTNNIQEILNLLYAAEVGNGINPDFSGTAAAPIAGEEWLFNFLSGVNSSGEPYYTYAIDTTSSDAVRLSENTNLFAAGGADGTMWESAMPLAEPTPLLHQGSFAHLVEQMIAEYANPNSALMDTAINVESIFYDSGYPLRTKRELCKFISERKDTYLWLSPYDVNGPALTASSEHSAAAALRTFAKIYAESDYFGTPTMRCGIMGRHGRLISSQYKKQLPLTLEVAVMSAKMMGSADGKWREGYVFDRAPNSIIQLFDNINVTFTPASARNRDWSTGLNWVQSYNKRQFFIPALQTVYDDDTSVLNSYFVAMACCELQKVGERVWRDFSGTIRLDDKQLVDRVNRSVENKTTGRFCDLFKIVPKAVVTAADKQRGYSWTLVIELFANGMKTVMTLDVRSRRMSDLDGAA